jgi:hypothetical protein
MRICTESTCEACLSHQNQAQFLTGVGQHRFHVCINLYAPLTSSDHLIIKGAPESTAYFFQSTGMNVLIWLSDQIAGVPDSSSDFGPS